MKHLHAEGERTAQPFLQALFAPGYTDSRPYAFLSRPALPGGERVLPEAPRPAVPPPASPPVHISITIGPNGHAIPTGAGIAVAPGALVEPPGFEKKYEDELDFSECAGFDDHFLGVYVPMPV